MGGGAPRGLSCGAVGRYLRAQGVASEGSLRVGEGKQTNKQSVRDNCQHTCAGKCFVYSMSCRWVFSSRNNQSTNRLIDESTLRELARVCLCCGYLLYMVRAWCGAACVGDTADEIESRRATNNSSTAAVRLLSVMSRTGQFPKHKPKHKQKHDLFANFGRLLPCT